MKYWWCVKNAKGCGDDFPWLVWVNLEISNCITLDRVNMLSASSLNSGDMVQYNLHFYSELLELCLCYRDEIDTQLNKADVFACMLTCSKDLCSIRMRYGDSILNKYMYDVPGVSWQHGAILCITYLKCTILLKTDIS